MFDGSGLVELTRSEVIFPFRDIKLSLKPENPHPFYRFFRLINKSVVAGY